MGDRRHQQGFNRAEYNERARQFCQTVFGTWSFFKMNLATKKIEPIKLSRAGLEINTAVFTKGIIGNVRQSEKRAAYFAEAHKKDVDSFSAVDELKKGAKIYTERFVYWATFQAPVKAEPSLKAA